jgi:hypothetical protein
VIFISINLEFFTSIRSHKSFGIASYSSKIKSFQGHIRTEAGIAALSSAAAASASIRVEAPLNLSALHGKYSELRQYSQWEKPAHIKCVDVLVEQPGASKVAHL